jgi:hypothetical protein
MSDFLDSAITAHNLWKARLRTAIDGGEIPDEKKVDVDNQCDLGKWIYGDGGKQNHSPEFQELKTKHTEFHHAAAGVIKLIKAGNKAGASEDLERGQFSKASSAVVSAIVKVKKAKAA